MSGNVPGVRIPHHPKKPRKLDGANSFGVVATMVFAENHDSVRQKELCDISFIGASVTKTFALELYSSGLRGSPGKRVGRESGAGVQISPTP